MPTAGQSIDYSKLRQDLVRAVGRICPAWLASQRDDLVQAAIMRIMQIVDKQPPPAAEGTTPFASSYLQKAAYSVLVDEIRRRTRRGETDLDDAPAERVTVSQPNPEAVAAAREVGRGIQDCLARLTRDRRLAVTLYLQGHSVPEAARLLDWPAKRTENLVYRGLADLRECLLNKGLQP